MNEQDKTLTASETEIAESKTIVENETNNEPPKKRPVVWLVLFNTIVSLILAFCIFATGVLGFSAYLFQDMHYDTDFPNADNHEALGIDPDIFGKPPLVDTDTDKKPDSSVDKDTDKSTDKDKNKDNDKSVVIRDKITNIALLGIDDKYLIDNVPPGGDSNRSDAIIIVSINETKKTVKLTSVLRDSWVPIDFPDGKRYDKINGAYKAGGPILAVKTLNQIFGLDITEYAAIGINGFDQLIDCIGGIDVTVTQEEMTYINLFTNSKEGDKNYLSSYGKVRLNGIQAIAFSRNRDLGSDTERVKRQQAVVQAIFQKIKSNPIGELPQTIKIMLGMIKTSLSYDEIARLLPIALENDLKIEKTSLPGDNIPASGDIFDDTGGLWVWKFDLEQAKKFMRKWVYGIESN